jgi:hypothetical protein
MKRKVIFIAAAALIAVVLGVSLNSRGAASAHAGGGQPVARLDTEPAPGQAVQAEQAQAVDGATWTMSGVRNAEGQLCAGEKIPAATSDAGQSWSCWDTKTMFANGPVNYSTGAVAVGHGKHYNVWVDGVAAPQVAKLVLELTNCKTIPLPVTANGLFHHVFGVGALAAGIAPQRLLAYDASGALLESGATRLAAVSLPTTTSC